MGLFVFLHSSDYLISVQSTVADLVSKLDTEEFNCELTEQPAYALLERANARKQDAVEAEKLRWQLEKKEMEITELKMNLRTKLDDISNYKPASALLERANARKQDAVEAEKLRWQLEKKEMEITELKMNLRTKLDDISNYKLRLELADKKIESMGKVDENEMQKLQNEKDEMQKQLKKMKL
ncbi:unnamed protein product [Gongylonema pulchrum]|uniref:HOOK domain-containing protein n=1 Tax=Gongylonema pulchrum TaxID=637853 RepID=A0A183DY72_9BILA|nr:unnamed protein product [Gongylonema pulchrum]